MKDFADVSGKKRYVHQEKETGERSCPSQRPIGGCDRHPVSGGKFAGGLKTDDQRDGADHEHPIDRGYIYLSDLSC